MSGGIDRLGEQLGSLLATYTRVSFDMWADTIRSPIERIFHIGVHGLICIRPFEYPMFTDVVSVGRSLPDPSYVEAKRLESGVIILEYQKKELDWIADFVLSAPSLNDKRVIIECDGHEFHERTKEQAAKDRSRDRSAQAAGYQILRFTGSELYHDPLKCVREALDAIKYFGE